MSGSGFSPFLVFRCITSTGISHEPLAVAHDQTERNAGMACKAGQGRGGDRSWEVSNCSPRGTPLEGGSVSLGNET